MPLNPTYSTAAEALEGILEGTFLAVGSDQDSKATLCARHPQQQNFLFGKDYDGPPPLYYILKNKDKANFTHSHVSPDLYVLPPNVVHFKTCVL